MPAYRQEVKGVSMLTEFPRVPDSNPPKRRGKSFRNET